jgi:hypothetical protein
LALLAQRIARDATGSRYWVVTRGGECACGLLHPEADVDGPTIRLNSELLKPLEVTLRHLAAHAGTAGFSLRAAYVTRGWDATSPRGRKSLLLSELLQLIRNGFIINNVVLEVKGAAAEHAH